MADTIENSRALLHTVFGEDNTSKMLETFRRDFEPAIIEMNIAPMAVGAVLVQIVAEKIRGNAAALCSELLKPGSITTIAVALVVLGLSEPQPQEQA